MVRWLLRALLPLGLIYPAGNVKRRLTNLASPHMDLSSVTKESLHYRGLPRLNSQVERRVVILSDLEL